MKPKLRQISPVLIELFWDEKPNDILLNHLLSWEIAISWQFGSEVIEVRKGFQTLSCVLKNDLKQSDLKAWQSFIEASIELFPLPSKLWEIPVCYDPELGKDLISLSKSLSLDIQKLITLHTEQTYRIHFFGFLPGFMYLNGLDPALHFPRKSIPDRKIEPGSVAIGGAQTGIYPTESPGGWHVIGKTPISLFDQNLSPPVFAKPGEQIQFIPISREEFEQLSNDPKPIKSHD
jgi:inhibitor of KinA